MFESVVERKGPGSECVSEGASEGERERGTCCVVEVHERVIVAKEAADRVVLQWVSDPVSDMVADAIVAQILSIEPSGAGRLTRSERTVEALPEKEGEAEGEGKKADAKAPGSEEEASESAKVKEEGTGEEGVKVETAGESDAAALEVEGKSEEPVLSESEWSQVKELLQRVFGSVEGDRDDGSLSVAVDGVMATVKTSGRRSSSEVEVVCDDEGLKKRVKDVTSRYLSVLRPIPTSV